MGEASFLMIITNYCKKSGVLISPIRSISLVHGTIPSLSWKTTQNFNTVPEHLIPVIIFIWGVLNSLKKIIKIFRSDGQSCFRFIVISKSAGKFHLTVLLPFDFKSIKTPVNFFNKIYFLLLIRTPKP